ncbi:hypothetical protein [Phaffia rhodozyma]|uniref:Uncharacterized protein n=1 Tax=Phaffia rhodozyma TaxID=264483 RepID=A0A0F7SKE9_PHARH|nr:hypothetical protein [Phaffia rhodozyma]
MSIVGGRPKGRSILSQPLNSSRPIPPTLLDSPGAIGSSSNSANGQITSPSSPSTISPVKGTRRKVVVASHVKKSGVFSPMLEEDEEGIFSSSTKSATNSPRPGSMRQRANMFEHKEESSAGPTWLSPGKGKEKMTGVDYNQQTSPLKIGNASNMDRDLPPMNNMSLSTNTPTRIGTSPIRPARHPAESFPSSPIRDYSTSPAPYRLDLTPTKASSNRPLPQPCSETRPPASATKFDFAPSTPTRSKPSHPYGHQPQSPHSPTKHTPTSASRFNLDKPLPPISPNQPVSAPRPPRTPGRPDATTPSTKERRSPLRDGFKKLCGKFGGRKESAIDAEMMQDADANGQVLWGRKEISAPVQVVGANQEIAPEEDLRRQTLWNLPAASDNGQNDTVTTRGDNTMDEEDLEEAFAAMSGMGEGKGLNVSFGQRHSYQSENSLSLAGSLDNLSNVHFANSTSVESLSLRSGSLFYFSQTSSPPHWVRTNCTLYPGKLQLSTSTLRGDFTSWSCALSKDASVRTVPEREAREKWPCPTGNEDEEDTHYLEIDLKHGAGVVVVAVGTIGERLGWVSSFWDAIFTGEQSTPAPQSGISCHAPPTTQPLALDDLNRADSPQSSILTTPPISIHDTATISISNHEEGPIYRSNANSPDGSVTLPYMLSSLPSQSPISSAPPRLQLSGDGKLGRGSIEDLRWSVENMFELSGMEDKPLRREAVEELVEVMSSNRSSLMSPPSLALESFRQKEGSGGVRALIGSLENLEKSARSGSPVGTVASDRFKNSFSNNPALPSVQNGGKLAPQSLSISYTAPDGVRSETLIRDGSTDAEISSNLNRTKSTFEDRGDKQLDVKSPKMDLGDSLEIPPARSAVRPDSFSLQTPDYNSARIVELLENNEQHSSRRAEKHDERLSAIQLDVSKLLEQVASSGETSQIQSSQLNHLTTTLAVIGTDLKECLELKQAEDLSRQLPPVPAPPALETSTLNDSHGKKLESILSMCEQLLMGANSYAPSATNPKPVDISLSTSSSSPSPPPSQGPPLIRTTSPNGIYIHGPKPVRPPSSAAGDQLEALADMESPENAGSDMGSEKDRKEISTRSAAPGTSSFIPPPELLEALDLLREQQAQRGAQSQQTSDIARYLNELNGWMEQFVRNGNKALDAVSYKVDHLSDVISPPPLPSPQIGQDFHPPGLLGMVGEMHALLVEQQSRGLNGGGIDHQRIEGLLASLEHRQQGIEKERPAIESVMELLERQRAENYNMLQAIRQELKGEIQGERIRFVDAMSQATSVNVTQHLEEFKKLLSQEVGRSMTDLGRMREEKKLLESQIAELFAIKVKHSERLSQQLQLPLPAQQPFPTAPPHHAQQLSPYVPPGHLPHHAQNQQPVQAQGNRLSYQSFSSGGPSPFPPPLIPLPPNPHSSAHSHGNMR